MRIKKVRNPKELEQMNPNFIYNRYDLFCKPEEYRAVKIINGNETKIVEYRLQKEQAELGIWLMQITKEELQKLVSYIGKNHPEVKKITYKNATLAYGKSRAQNHFRIVFPETVEEMEHRISYKSRQKMRKKLRFAEEAYGKMEIHEYQRNEIPMEVVEAFFAFKYATRNRVYRMTPEEYLDRYHVSDCYVFTFGGTIGAVRFSCEQCPIVYGENFAYNPDMRDYSLGKAVFFHHLVRMVEKKHTELFFAGGDFEYKTHYGSIEETVYDGTIPVTRESFRKKIKRHLKKLLPGKVLRGLQKCRKKLGKIKKK